MKIFEIDGNRIDLSSVIKTIVNEWIANGWCKSAKDINTGKASGCCDDFASNVIEYSGGVFEADNIGLMDVALTSFMTEDGLFDLDLINSHWKYIKPTHGLSWEQMDQLAIEAGFNDCTHVWLVYNGKHYDSECPDGVFNFFDLPFFVRVITDWKIHKGL